MANAEMYCTLCQSVITGKFTIQEGTSKIFCNDCVPKDDRVTFTSGAQSSGKLPPYHLIPFMDGVLDRLANRYQLGLDKGYPLDNWRKGLTDDAYVADRLNHGVNHLMRAIAKITRGDYTIGDDDDLAGAMWAIAFAMVAQKVRGGVK